MLGLCYREYDLTKKSKKKTPYRTNLIMIPTTIEIKLHMVTVKGNCLSFCLPRECCIHG